MSLECPACRSTKLMDHGRKFPVYPAGCVWILGFPIAIFHQGQTPHQLECEECGARFKRRTLLARINLAGLVLVAGLVLWAIASVVWQLAFAAEAR
ncbi:hypothetical protein [Luteolibacter marinus]|uniref:hypothetical protein n=1 Tax=Luteolibacter marinus TaxID=2776705 RepID=UPI0018690276|nr:hypothetical protein [Luteolibacter marinus]